MKVHEMCLAGVVALALLASACTGSSEGAVATPTADSDETVVPEPTAERTPAEVPTPDPTESVTDEQRIDAAVAQFEVDVAAGEVDSVFAYDLLDTKIDPDGNVTLTVCAWAGDTVFDQVRDSIYRTRAESDATVTATRITTPVAGGECVNSQLIESALDHVGAFDRFLVGAGLDPTRVDTDAGRALLTEAYADVLVDIFAQFISDDVYFEGVKVPGDVAETAVADLLWRRLRTDGRQTLEIAVCRDMAPNRGMYRDGVLIDDGRSEDSPGLHSIDLFELTPDNSYPGQWRVAGHDALIWTDCFSGSGWSEEANLWQPQDIPLVVLE